MKSRFALLLLFLFFLPAGLNAQDDLFRNFQSDSKYQDVLIERVVSADTILLDTGEKFRLIGLKAPDAPRRRRTEFDNNGNIVIPEAKLETTIEEAAFAFAVKLLQGKRVRLEFDTDRKDEEFVALAYVFLKDGTFANAEILRQGYADLKVRPPNLKYDDRLREAYRQARAEKRGLQGD